MISSMRAVCITISVFLSLLIVDSAKADENACLTVYRDSTRNYDLNQSRNVQFSDFFEKHCESNGEAKASSLAGNIELDIEIISGLAGFSGNDSRESLREFCEEKKDTNFSDVREFAAKNTILNDALQSFNQCLSLFKKNLLFTHTYSPTVGVSITGAPQNRMTRIYLSAVNYNEKELKCSSNDFTTEGESEEIKGDSKRREIKENFTISCMRTAQDKADRIKYPKTEVTVATSEGAYVVHLPEEELLGFHLASEASNLNGRLRKQLEDTQAELGDVKGQLERKDSYTVLVVGPGMQGALTHSGATKFIRSVGCLRPVEPTQRDIVEREKKLACIDGYTPKVIGEISHSGGGECGQTVVQINCVRR